MKITLIPQILLPNRDEDWLDFAARVIENSVNDVLKRQSNCNLMLTGGVTAESIYKVLAKKEKIFKYHLRLFFGDERCVPPDHIDSNFGMVKRTLLQNGIPENWIIFPIHTIEKNLDESIRKYQAAMPSQMNIILLSMGIDGHIASIFPHSHVFTYPSNGRVAAVYGGSVVQKRITATPEVILNAETVLLFVTGAEKGKALNTALKSDASFLSFPAMLVKKGWWLMDSAAYGQIDGVYKHEIPN